MSQENFENAGASFNKALRKLLEGLSPSEQGLVLRGVFLAAHSLAELGSPEKLTPFQRAKLLNIMITMANSTAIEKRLAVQKEIKAILEEGTPGLLAHYTEAAQIQDILGPPLSEEEERAFRKYSIALSSNF